jgi:hypothetical protein
MIKAVEAKGSTFILLRYNRGNLSIRVMMVHVKETIKILPSNLPNIDFK